MSIDLYIKRIRFINELIQKRKTGSPDELAVKLGISARMLYSYIKIMKEDLGAPILFDESINSYVYTNPGTMPMKFVKAGKKNKG